MSTKSTDSPTGYSTQTSGVSRASSSSFMSDQSYPEQRFQATPSYCGGSTSSSVSGAFQPRMKPRRIRSFERPSLFSSFPKIYNTKVLRCYEEFICPEFKLKNLENDIGKVLQGETIFYPSTAEHSPNQSLKAIVTSIRDYFEKKGAFVFFGSSILLLLNKPFPQSKFLEKLVGDLFIVSNGSPMLLLTVADCHDPQEFKPYNASLVQNLHHDLRNEVVGLRAIMGVVTLDDFETKDKFGDRLRTLREEASGLPNILSGVTLSKTVYSFLKILAKCSSPLHPQDKNRYLMNKMFMYFIELMEERNNVLVTSSSFESSIALLSEMVTRMTLAGELSLHVYGYEVVPELHSLGQLCASSSVVIIYDQPKDTDNMMVGDICLTTLWKKNQKWIFRPGSRVQKVRSPNSQDQKKKYFPIQEGVVETRRKKFELQN